MPIVPLVSFSQAAPVNFSESFAMSTDRDRLDKVLAVAVNPGAYENEAIAALRKARELVKQNPSLAHPPPPTAPTPKPASPDEASFQSRITKVRPDWLLVFLNSLSQEAYGLGLKSKMVCDFSEIPTAVDVRCDGPYAACQAFQMHLQWLIDYFNSQLSKP